MHRSAPGARQRGVVLVVSLVMLIVVTLLALSGAQSSVGELRTSSNMLSRNVAFAIAETGLVEGEQQIETNHPGAPAVDFSADATDGYYYDGDIADITAVWDGADGYEAGADGSTYVVEYLGPFATAGGSLSLGAGAATNVRYLYRVSALGQGFRGGSHLLQSFYATSN